MKLFFAMISEAPTAREDILREIIRKKAIDSVLPILRTLGESLSPHHSLALVPCKELGEMCVVPLETSFKDGQLIITVSQSNNSLPRIPRGTPASLVAYSLIKGFPDVPLVCDQEIADKITRTGLGSSVKDPYRVVHTAQGSLPILVLPNQS